MTTHTDEMNEAQVYALRIADEVRALDALLADPYEKDLRAAYLAELELTHLEETADGGDILHTWLNETVLDVSVLIDTRPDTLNGRVSLLRTSGGPRCEINRDTNDGSTVVVECWWASDYGRVSVWAGHLASFLDELVEIHEPADFD